MAANLQWLTLRRQGFLRLLGGDLQLQDGFHIVAHINFSLLLEVRGKPLYDDVIKVAPAEAYVAHRGSDL